MYRGRLRAGLHLVMCQAFISIPDFSLLCLPSPRCHSSRQHHCCAGGGGQSLAQGGHLLFDGTRSPPRGEAQQSEGRGSGIPEDHIHLRYTQPFTPCPASPAHSHPPQLCEELSSAVRARCWGNQMHARQALASGGPRAGAGRGSPGTSSVPAGWSVARCPVLVGSFQRKGYVTGQTPVTPAAFLCHPLSSRGQ